MGIICVLGGVGSGKSVYASRFAVGSQFPSYVNWNLKYNNVIRIKKDHVIQTIDKETPKGKIIQEQSVNYEYWTKQKDINKNFNICLDEVHNLFNSRRSSTKFNILGGMWISQIRKQLGTSEQSDILLVSQRMKKIDLAFRDLTTKIVLCSKLEDNNRYIKTPIIENNRKSYKILPAIYIYCKFFQGRYCREKYDRDIPDYKSMFFANPFFQYYDTWEIFGETAYL